MNVLTARSLLIVVAMMSAGHALARDLIWTEESRAGRPVRFGVKSDSDQARKVRFEVRHPDGTRESLPGMEIRPPFPGTGSTIEGPTIPASAGGRVLIVEIVEPDTGKVLSKGAAPIGFPRP